MDILNAEMEITTRCNQNCRLCTRGTPEIVDIDIEWVRKCHNYEVLFLVGPRCEPTLHPNFLEILEIFKSKKIIVDLYSNVTTHTPEWWSEIGKMVNVLKFAIDLEKHWEIYRRTKTWHKMVENVKAFTEGGGRAWAHMIEFEHNSGDFEETAQLAKKLGCEQFRKKISWNYDDVCKRPGSHETRWEQSQKLDTKLKCGYLMNKKVSIDPYGDITPCCFTVMTDKKKKILEKDDWKHLVVHASSSVRGDLKTLERAQKSKLFDYILTNKEDLWNCTQQCKVSYKECSYYDERQLKTFDANKQKRLENKQWLVDELVKWIPKHWRYNVLVVGGWHGQLSKMLQPYVNKELLSIDIDPKCTEICQKQGINAATADMFDIDYKKWNIVINTSCEHIDLRSWLELVEPHHQIVVLQSTNMPWVDHVNTVGSLGEFKDQARLSEVWYEGVSDTHFYKYKRFMLIGVI
jgi:MoaA/NifB/PqqE/SkfB family radical SAM enzyme